MTLDIAAIRASFPDRDIHYYTSVDSTMHRAAELETGGVVLAEEQTGGLGRHGHAWHSESGSGIYCSLVLQPAPVLTLALGLATVDAIALSTGVICDLRWPNDLMMGPLKVAGILVQLVDGKAIAGIGINVNHGWFPPELAHEATSLAMITGQQISREQILYSLLPAIDEYLARDTETILRLFTHASSYVAGRRVRVEQAEGAIEGTTVGLTPDGYLVVRKDDGTDTLILAGGVRAAGS
jgi:BirA family biotin operon repressor/biotin-[acetyl-CoA-carboxylase] ligase